MPRGKKDNDLSVQGVTSISHAVFLLADNPRMGAPLNSKYEVDADLRYVIAAK